MIVRTCRIEGNQRYSWIKNIIVHEPDATMPPTPQDIQLMSKHRVLKSSRRPPLPARPLSKRVIQPQWSA
jgi:hypothetical protein